MVWQWTKDEGPVTSWAKRIKHELRDAKPWGTTRRIVDDWRAHAGVGKALLRDLTGFASAAWPRDEERLRDMVRQTFELLQTLQAGISVIETSLSDLGNEGDT
jgi:hypothetical protein